MKTYMVYDCSDENNQVGPFEAIDMIAAMHHLEEQELESFDFDCRPIDETHSQISINLPGGAKYKYEIIELVGALFCPMCGKRALIEVLESPQINVGDGHVTRRICKSCDAVIFI